MSFPHAEARENRDENCRADDEAAPHDRCPMGRTTYSQEILFVKDGVFLAAFRADSESAEALDAEPRGTTQCSHREPGADASAIASGTTNIPVTAELVSVER